MDPEASHVFTVDSRQRTSASGSVGWARPSAAVQMQVPTHRQSLPTGRGQARVPRRSSGLQRELQQPSRRLSSHQLLLLTPFGEALPAGSLELSTNVPLVRGPTRSRPSHGHAFGSQPLEVIPSDESAHAAPSVVPMTRSNSLPILSLQELAALRQRDEEHGIVRGGQWAWVSKDVEVINEALEQSPLFESAPKHSMPPPVPSTFQNPFFPVFNQDPFGSSARASATAENYIYDGSPRSGQNARRASEATSSSSASTSTSPLAQTLRELRPRQGRSIAEQGKTASPPSPAKPPLVRYKSSPARTSGLGLSINVVGSPPPTDSVSPGTLRSTQRQGSWASVSVLDGGLAAMDIATAESHASRRASVIQLPTDFMTLRGSFDLTMDDDSPELEPKARRGRFESIDSALPVLSDVGQKVAITRWVDRFSSWPRRGSLAVDILPTKRREASG